MRTIIEGNILKISSRYVEPFVSYAQISSANFDQVNYWAADRQVFLKMLLLGCHRQPIDIVLLLYTLSKCVQMCRSKF